MASKLGLSTETIADCRRLARQVADGVRRETERYTTVSTERTVLRLLGVDGVDAEEVPIPNRVVEALQACGKLGRGAAVWMGSALARGRAERRRGGRASLGSAPGRGAGRAPGLARSRRAPRRGDASNGSDRTVRSASAGWRRIRRTRNRSSTPSSRRATSTKTSSRRDAAARAGAQCIAVIRSTAQSLLDHVPYGATTSGFGGTYATQENFRLMRAALDAIEPELGRYVRLVNYCSGLCMPEIAAMGALERLDMMLNDALYGIIFRDINPLRTLIDQNFSRRINAVAGVVINTGEDNYLTTADAVEQAPAVLASQFINERLAKDAGLEDWQIGLGHAFEIDPALEDGLLYEIAQAEAAREIFPDAPLKYMPPTKHMTGNVFQGYQQNTLFALTSVATRQSIHLLGMLTEALHTPFLHDRWLAIDQMKTLRSNARHLADEIRFAPDGRIVGRARDVLAGAEAILARVAGYPEGLFGALAEGVFADTRRRKDGGRGFDGVVRKRRGLREPVSRGMEPGEPAASRSPRERTRDSPSADPAVRRQEERRRRAGVVHAADRPLRRREGSRQALCRQDGPAGAVRHARRGHRTRVHVLRRLRPRDPRRRRRRDHGRGSARRLAFARGDRRRDRPPLRAAARSSSDARSNPTPTPSASTRSST